MFSPLHDFLARGATDISYMNFNGTFSKSFRICLQYLVPLVFYIFLICCNKLLLKYIRLVSTGDITLVSSEGNSCYSQKYQSRPYKGKRESLLSTLGQSLSQSAGEIYSKTNKHVFTKCLRTDWGTCCNCLCCFLGQVILNHIYLGGYAINLYSKPLI